MTVMNPLAVVAQYFPFDNFMFTYNVPTTVTTADEGKAVTIDTSAANSVKLTSVAEELIIGRIFKVEDRRQQGGGVIATIERKFRAKLPYTGTAPTIGQAVAGSTTPGVVKVAASQAFPLPNRVIEVDATLGTVTVEHL